MDAYLRKQLHENSLNFKTSLDRIIDKYSKLQHEDGGIEVDLDIIQTKTLEDYMRLSKIDLNKLESKSLDGLQEESLKEQDITISSRLDFSHEDGRSDKTSFISQFSGDDYAMAKSDSTQLTVSSLDESQRSFPEAELQPEDQDEELELTLRSHGSTLVELYPSMISRIEKAWHRKNVSEVADSVLRRYRRWRQQSNRSNLNNTFIVTLRHTNSNTKKMTSRTLLKKNFKRREKKHFTGIESASPSPLRTVSNLQEREARQQCLGTERGQQTRDKYQPILAMDLSGATEPQDILLNETFTVSEPTQTGVQPSTYSASPSRPCYPTTKASLDQSLWSKRLSLSAQSEQAAGRSMYAVKERPDIYGSPVRQSPSIAMKMTSLSGSPQSLSKSSRQYSVDSFSRVTTRPRSISVSLSSPQQKRCEDLRMLYPQNSNSLHPQLRSPQSSTAGHRRLCRQLSFDSLQPSFRVFCSPKKLDEDFKKLYHKFVCQNKSVFSDTPPCRLCGGKSEANKSNSASALAALALSPHRSVLRKRHRELEWNSQPQSKRSREECYTSSPGSKRHSKEMLRRCLSPSELEQAHDDLALSSSKHSMFQKVSTKKRLTDAPQEAWMLQGDRLESSVATSYSPGKW
ncbi:uncharacterized protein si:dkeyp-117h8.4 [Channa argus]|uniref:uncharacterized protein si:dkeyp-117h8.4 n=1 Tax=Channa argus TaxID=215402 RepID=UPI00294588B1|nr:hypothetical protein Q8A73_008669 [Channa argus]